MAAVSNAYALEDIAKKMPNLLGTTSKARSAAFESAAQAYLVCARDAPESGSGVYKDCCRLAAKCFEEAGNTIKAAENYRIAENFTKAALLFKKSSKFDDAYDIITNHSDKVASEDLKNVKDVIRLYYFREKKFQWVTYFLCYVYPLRAVLNCSSEKPTRYLPQWKKKLTT